MPLRHRSNQKAGFFFTTTSTEGRIKRFIRPEHFDIVMRNIEYYRKRDKAVIHGFVIMPTHLHFLVFIPEEKSISSFMDDMKKRVAFEYNRLISSGPFHFWEHRFDGVVIYSEKIYYTKLKYIHNNPVKAGLAATAEEWEYSSAKFYLTGINGIITVTPI
jgi:putative transposase